ncbi:hypothetical protein M9H77_35100 [Catharanthus roseus]|uniref:Uncharacterized protein n=1 Tax=Catharanthus roseus TaxID=4058 RepID=A0ACB9ZNS9_CATRO|nr:hypothetical protein M9H77_35100 [Catharanthus roseus]
MDYTGFQVGNLPCRYLGIPLWGVYLKLLGYAPLYDKVTKTLLAFVGLNLSYAGKLEVITSVVIASLCRRFLWGGNFSKGGIGLRDSKKWNDNKKDTLWRRWIQHYYIKDSTIWEIMHKKDFPPLVKRLLTIRDVILQAEGIVGAAMDRISDWVRGDTFQTNPTFPPKFSFIMWLTISGRFPTRDRLKFLEVDRTCNLCKQKEETLSYLFFACPFRGDIWTVIREWDGLRRRMTTTQSCIK